MWRPHRPPRRGMWHYNEAILEMDFMTKHSFSNSFCRKCYKGEFLYVLNLFFNDNVYLKFGGVYLYRAENEK